MRTIHVIVTGTVQGVGFRFSTRRQAVHLGLAGWVRNQPDGSVALCAQGSTGAVDRLIAFLEKGPPGASVTSVTIEDIAPDPALTGFDIRF
jgi:acylphosphatase